MQLCYWKVPVSTISRAYQGVTEGSVAQPKCQNALFSRDLRRSEYASSNQGVRGSNPFGRTKINRLAAVFLDDVLMMCYWLDRIAQYFSRKVGVTAIGTRTAPLM